MSYKIEDFQNEKKRLRKLAFGSVIVEITCICTAISCYFLHNSNSCAFFSVFAGLTGLFLLLVGAERLELSSIKKLAS